MGECTFIYLSNFGGLAYALLTPIIRLSSKSSQIFKTILESRRNERMYIRLISQLLMA